MSAQRTLGVAQSLYETHKLLSYPAHRQPPPLGRRGRDAGPDRPGRQGPTPAELLAPGTGQRPLSRRFVDDAKVTDHHAIIPTSTRAGAGSPRTSASYDLVCRLLRRGTTITSTPSRR